MPKIVEIEPCM